jgi:hypothetical protein
MKPKRIVDLELISYVKTLPCIACGERGGDAHHVTTVGAGGNDLPDNLIPLDRKHHSEWHSIGPSRMVEKYPSIRLWLECAKREDVLERISKWT